MPVQYIRLRRCVVQDAPEHSIPHSQPFACGGHQLAQVMQHELGSPATLVATRKVRVLAFMRTQKPESMRSRSMRPSLTELFTNRASVISTIGISFPWQNEDNAPGIAGSSALG